MRRVLGTDVATRLNLGSGDFPLEGYTNVDAHAPSADIQADFMTLEFADVEEVVMSHVLEHFSWRDSVRVLSRVRSWMREGGTLTVEVPDIEALFLIGTSVAGWQSGMFGAQINDGEYHKAGFTPGSLAQVVVAAGFRVERTSTFRSTNPYRPGYPCIEIVAVAIEPGSPPVRQDQRRVVPRADPPNLDEGLVRAGHARSRVRVEDHGRIG